MIPNKMSALLQLALRYERFLTQELKDSFIVDAAAGLWQVVMIYIGNLDDLRQAYGFVTAEDLNGSFASITIEKSRIGELSNQPNVLRLSLPRQMNYIDIGLGQICGNQLASSIGTATATGEGALLAVIDSGIRYNHPDFREDSGETRIVYLWDQTLESDVNTRKGGGVVYTEAQINKALTYASEREQLAIVPSQDTVGHGTAITGIAAGNGRGSIARQNKGVASDCQLIVVKVGKINPFMPTDLEIMYGIDFAIEKAVELRKPLTILIGVGDNLGGHNGTTPLEVYMSRRYDNWLLNFVVGMGNEGNQNAHTSGMLQTGQIQTLQIAIDTPNLSSYACCIWKKFSDDISLVLQTPTGETTESLSLLTPNRAYLFGETAVLINYASPLSSINQQVIYILFQAQDGATIGNGIWTLILSGAQILEGDYHVWGDIVPRASGNTVVFLNATIDITLTTPASAYSITTVGAYNGTTRQVEAFSGRGPTADQRMAPDLVAPGVDIIAPASTGENLYQTISGTSAAAAFVAGAYVVMMAYAVYTLNNLNYYGEELKIFLMRTAQRPTSYGPYPNNSWGYGLLCIEAAILYMKEVSEQTT